MALPLNVGSFIAPIGAERTPFGRYCSKDTKSSAASARGRKMDGTAVEVVMLIKEA
jgi:hypothetical protein